MRIAFASIILVLMGCNLVPAAERQPTPNLKPTIDAMVSQRLAEREVTMEAEVERRVSEIVRGGGAAPLDDAQSCSPPFPSDLPPSYRQLSQQWVSFAIATNQASLAYVPPGEPFINGYLTQGLAPSVTKFKTFPEFLRRGGKPLTSLMAIQRMRFGAEQLPLFETCSSPYQDDKFFQENMYRYFNPGATPVGQESARNTRYNLVVETEMARYSHLVGEPLRGSINYQRNLFNGSRTKGTDPFFIDDYIKPGGQGESMARSH